jgi:molybdopterin-guanine dinucleotide biosynthesis protein A
MGGRPKPLLRLGSGTILQATLDRLGAGASPVAVNAGDDPGAFAPLPVIPDPALPPGVEARPGPLAGLLAAMEWAGARGAREVITVPGDAPFLPFDLVTRLRAAGAPAVAASEGRLHPVAGLWPTAAAPALRAALAAGTRRVEAFARAVGARAVGFPRPADGPDPFLNVNTPEDLEEARRWVGRA